MKLKFLLGAGAAAFALSGCSGAPIEGDEISAGEAGDLGQLEEAIKDGIDVSYGSAYARSTVLIGNCTGTIIGPRHVITAAHCSQAAKVGALVRFYTGADTNGQTAEVDRIYMARGVSHSDTSDVDGKFADYAVAFLDRTIPSTSQVAKLAWRWPGNNVTMAQVGNGYHDGVVNNARILRYRSTLSYSASNADGHVLVEAITDGGDSGGPVYTTESGKLVVNGVNWGNAFEWAMRGKYTSTSYHLGRIAKALGLTTKLMWDYPGSDIARFDGVTPNRCISECLASTSCKAFTHVPQIVMGGPGTCFLKSGVGGGGNAAAQMISGAKGVTGSCALEGGFCRL